MSMYTRKKILFRPSLIIKFCVLIGGWIGVQSITTVKAQEPITHPVILEFNIDSAYVVRENRFTRVEFIHSGDTLQIDPNITTFIRVAVPDRPPVMKELNHTPGSISSISINLEKSDDQNEIIQNNHAVAYLSGKNVVIETDGRSKVYYNWDYVGSGTQSLRVGSRI